jgi:hypothetical protein
MKKESITFHHSDQIEKSIQSLVAERAALNGAKEISFNTKPTTVIKPGSLFGEFWKLKNLNQLYEIYPQIRHKLPSFLKLHKALKKRGLNPNNVEWFADAIETAAIKIRDSKEVCKDKR